MKIDNISTNQIGSIHLAFDPNILESLIWEGKLHASDFNSLDSTSQKGVWVVMLAVAATTVCLS